MKIRWSDIAEADLDQLYDYIAELVRRNSQAYCAEC